MFDKHARGIHASKFRFLILAGFFMLASPGLNLFAQEESNGAAKHIIDFARDIRPIFNERCLECHGPKQAKNDFRVDDQESVMAYVEPGDSSSSSIWTDYLITDDEEMLMPPASHEKPLSGTQLASIKLWIEEGAAWAEAEVTTTAPTPVKRSKVARLAAFAGLFHPAIVHFPIALLLISTVFSFLAFFKPSAFDGPAFHCLWVGAISAWAASMLGWFYADARGYSGVGFDFASGLDRHRWAALGMSVFALALIPVAISARKKTNNRRMHLLWFVGSVVLALIVSMVGHQGGELVYGEDIYTDAFNAIFEDDRPVSSDSSPETKAEDDPAAGVVANSSEESKSTAEPVAAPEKAPESVSDTQQ